MLSLEDCRQLINEAIGELNLPAEPANLYDPIRYTMQLGGKRIRPALLMMAANVYSEDIRPTLYPALALEMFHNFTLLHDDIMDDSALRRNHPAVHVKWNRNTGILSGDAMLIKTYELLSKSPGNCIEKLFALFNKVALGVCEGQQYDMDFEVKNSISMPEYLNMIELKTAVLLGGALQAGAIIGGADDENAARFYEAGKSLGIAFQLQDDWLDVYADPEKFGKQRGNDIVSNKKTILLVRALQLASGRLQEDLVKWLKKKQFQPEEKIRAVKEIYDALNIKEQTLEKIRSYHQEALEYLHAVNIAEKQKSELYAVADYLLFRNK